jgi:hypothetical protein
MTAVAPAPWDTVVDAVVWWHRAIPGAAAHAPVRGPALPVTVGAMIRYRETPVGPYHELLGSPMVVGGAASVPFIAVDSEPSVRGGRENWNLPKVLAEFDWPREASGDGWALRARVRARPRRLPVRLAFPTRQPGLIFWSRVSGTARVGSVEVETDGVPGWLLPGRHAALILERSRVLVSQPR